MARTKKIIKSLFILRMSPDGCMYDLGLLTDDLTYFDCQVRYSGEYLIPRLQYSLQKAFYSFQFTCNTDVMYSESIPKWNPILAYFQILSTQLHFKLRKTSLVNIPRRISCLHRSYAKHVELKNVSMYDINSIWTKIIKNERCPWITQDVENSLSMFGRKSKFYKRKQFLRLALYYMLVKQHLYVRAKRYLKNSEKTNNKNIIKNF